MGVISGAMGVLFGQGGNVVRDTVEVFRENAEAAAGREADGHAAALAQYAAEFARPPRGRFDSFMDGVNRVPRPALALGTLGLFVAAMVDPIWFTRRMVGLGYVPEPLWWLLGAIVSFYFGARHQAKGQEFQRSIAATLVQAPVVAAAAGADSKPPAAPAPTSIPRDTRPGWTNAALADWRAEYGH